MRVPLADGTLVAAPGMPDDDLIRNRTIDPGKVVDLELPLDQAPQACTAMDERRAIKVLLRP